MISKNVISFCLTPELIENYDSALNDKNEIWECHHRLETHFSDGTPRPKASFISKYELIALGSYYNISPNELIFMRKKDHRTLHHKDISRNKGKTPWNKGKKGVQSPHIYTEEEKLKISKALKGKPKSTQHIESMRKARLGKKASAETKIKMSESAKKAWAKRKGD